MKSLIPFTTAVGLLSVPPAAMADADHSSVMELPSRFLMDAYAAVEDGLRPTEFMSAISRTDLQALRDLVSPEDWGNIYDFASFRGYLGLGQAIAEESVSDPDRIGSDPNTVAMLTLFQNATHSQQQWGMIDERSAITAFDAALSKTGAVLIDKDLIGVSRPTFTDDPAFFVMRDGTDLIARIGKPDEDGAGSLMAANPDYVHFSNAYTAMIDTAEKLVPENATIVELSVRSWGNRTPDRMDFAFPKNITDPVDAYGAPLTPVFGFAIVDWRMPSSQYGVTLAVNHFDACEEGAEYSSALTDRWNASVSTGNLLADVEMTLRVPFQLIEQNVDGVPYCSTSVSIGPFEAEDRLIRSGYSDENLAYRAVNYLLFQEFTGQTEREGIFSLQW